MITDMTIIESHIAIMNELRALRAEVAALHAAQPGAPDPLALAAAMLAAAAYATWGSSAEVPAAAYAALPPGHPVTDALAALARARGIAPPVGPVAVGALLARAAALPGSRLRYRRLTAGGRWRVVAA